MTKEEKAQVALGTAKQCFRCKKVKLLIEFVELTNECWQCYIEMINKIWEKNRKKEK